MEVVLRHLDIATSRYCPFLETGLTETWQAESTFMYTYEAPLVQWKAQPQWSKIQKEEKKNLLVNTGVEPATLALLAPRSSQLS